MTVTTTTWPGSSVVQPGIERPTAMRLAETEYQRITDVVDGLQPEDWARPTDCTAWDVRQLVAHIAGQANSSTPLELARQTRAAKARQQPGQPGVDALTALQVEERQHVGPEELRAERIASARAGPRDAAEFPASYAAGAVRGRRSLTAYRRHGPSVTSLMSSSLATRGCTASTSLGQQVEPRCSPPTTTASSSPTSWPSGLAVTASPTG